MNYATARALQAVELLAFAPRSATEVAEILHVHPRTARRLLAKLVEEQYATRLPRRGRFGPVYVGSPRVVALGAQAIERLPITAAAQGELGDLSRGLRLATFVAVPSYRQVVVVHGVGSGPRRWDR